MIFLWYNFKLIEKDSAARKAEITRRVITGTVLLGIAFLTVACNLEIITGQGNRSGGKLNFPTMIASATLDHDYLQSVQKTAVYEHRIETFVAEQTLQVP